MRPAGDYDSGMRLSVRYQLLLPLISLLVGLLVMSVWTTWSSVLRVRGQIEQRMNAIAATVKSVTIPRNLPTLRLMRGLSGAELMLCESPRQPLTGEGSLTTLARMPESLPEPGEAGLGSRVQVGGVGYLCRGVPLGSDQTPGHYLYIFYPEALWKEALWQELRPALILGGVGLAALAATVAFANGLARRIQQMERRTRLIADGDFSPMTEPSGNDEIRDLSRSINHMASRLADFEETVQKTERLRLLGQVSGGLAHQLRNGVAGARLAVQLLERDPDDREALEVALRQLVLIETHLKRFLDLGRSLDLPRVPVDLLELLEETIALVRPQCRHAHIELLWKQPEEGESWVISGDRDQLGQMLLNIITNAMEASGTNGRVTVSLRRIDRQALVEVSDTGPGPADSVRDRLFEPFVTGKPEGVGIGLAVSRQVALAHDGGITWRRDNGLTLFSITLPLAAWHGMDQPVTEATW